MPTTTLKATRLPSLHDTVRLANMFNLSPSELGTLVRLVDLIEKPDTNQLFETSDLAAAVDLSTSQLNRQLAVLLKKYVFEDGDDPNNYPSWRGSRIFSLAQLPDATKNTKKSPK